MKTNVFIKFGLALGVVFTAAIGAMSFKTTEKKAATVYYYVSGDIGPNAFREVSHWSTVNSGGSCSEDNPARPCKITVPSGSSLNSVLSGKNNDQVMAISEGYKPALNP